MDSALIEFGRQAPYVGLMVVLVLIFLNWIQKSEATRTENAKELDEERREFEREINAMWANAIRSMMEQQEKAQAALMSALDRHELASQQRYERMRKTDDLIQAIQERNKGKDS